MYFGLTLMNLKKKIKQKKPEKLNKVKKILARSLSMGKKNSFIVKLCDVLILKYTWNSCK